MLLSLDKNSVNRQSFKSSVENLKVSFWACFVYVRIKVLFLLKMTVPEAHKQRNSHKILPVGIIMFVFGWL